MFTNFIEQQKKNEEEAQRYRVVLEESLAKLTGVRGEHSRQMAIAFKNAGRLNLDVHAKEFFENKRREKSTLSLVLREIKLISMLFTRTHKDNRKLLKHVQLELNKNPFDPHHTMQMRLLHWKLGEIELCLIFPEELFNYPPECPFSLHNLCCTLLHLQDRRRLPPYVASDATELDILCATVLNTNVRIARNMPPDITRKNV